MKGIKEIVIFVIGGITGGLFFKRKEKEKRLSEFKTYKKFEALYHLMNQWMSLYEMGVNVSELLLAAGYKKIAIYGMADVGKHLYHALQGSAVEVCYGIDRGKSGQYESIEVKKPEEELAEVDAIIVTAVVDFEEIKGSLQKKKSVPVISLEEILYEGVWR